jgi:predicted aconitase
MRLSKEEEGMLNGKYGHPLQKAMEILVAVGECYNAVRLIPIKSGHLVSSNPVTAGTAGAAFIEQLAKTGSKFKIFTDTNPACLDLWNWKQLGFSKELYEKQITVSENIRIMGGYLSNTCTPYLVGHIPSMGQHIAWSESSATIFANAVLGARTNRESGPSVLAAALTGRTPDYGYHLLENRYAQLKIIVDVELRGIKDYGTLGYFAGKIAGDKVPLFKGIPKSVSTDQLKMLGAALATSGSVAHYHVIGVTPEAPSEESALGGKKLRLSDTYQFAIKELEETEHTLGKERAREVNLLILGCPHASISELKMYADVLAKNKVKSDVWILTSHMIKTYAEKMGFVNVLEASGAKVLNDTCPIAMPRGFLKKLGYSVVATDSAKMAYYVTSAQELKCYYSDLEQYFGEATGKVGI